MLASCGPTIYKSADLEQSKNKVKVVAILPYWVTMEGKRMSKGMDANTLASTQQKSGYDLQNATYSWMLKRSTSYTIRIQDVDQTNALLDKAGLNYESILLTEKGDLCKLLGVDAVITGKAIMSKPMSEGAAITTFVLTGYSGATNKTNVSLTIHNNSSDLLWKYDYQANGGIGSSPTYLTNALMRNASKKFPYRKA